jgi:hypothetical protein
MTAVPPVPYSKRFLDRRSGTCQADAMLVYQNTLIAPFFNAFKLFYACNIMI